MTGKLFLLALGIIAIILTAITIKSYYNFYYVFNPSSVRLQDDVSAVREHFTDIVIELNSKKNTYFYINRGLENGLALDSFEKDLTNKKIILVYSPVHKRTIPIDTIIVNDKVYYKK